MSFHPQFDSLGRASLDGTWEFFPGDHAPTDLDGLDPVAITVPALWEAQGHLDLDGPAWYRRRFDLDGVDGYWTLSFGAVMDLAEVHLNGQLVGHHDLPFTPFDFDVADLVRAGTNVLDVRVVDPPLGDPEHVRSPHGKQGWMNHVFPSRPSLYMTYGGIWQSVHLRRHGPVVIEDVFVNGVPSDLVVEVQLENRVDHEVVCDAGVHVLGRVRNVEAVVPPRGRTTVRIELGRTAAPVWSPEDPVLHEVVVDLRASGAPSDLRTTRFGLRTVGVDGPRLVVNGEPYRMRSVLVQGFTADRLYAEGSREDIEVEVRLAKAMGFNTLRLHIKAFDPVYLDVCDEVGVFVHCDLPVAEPLVHEEMGGDTLLVRRCVQAITEQVRRDRNHPSVILWSAMNEVCDGRREARQWPEYEHFARTLAGAVAANDPTRPVIENDWVEPDPERVFTSPILTAHWYGQLHNDYLDKIEAASLRWSGTQRPFFVSEFGDWGLPQMPTLEAPAFWDTRALYEAALGATLWPGSVDRFTRETQRYQGIADRLQMEVWRRHDGIGGYCLTELTDVPHELNGLLDLERRPKPLAVAEVARANQPVLPMLQLPTLVVEAGELLHAVLHIANDGPRLEDVQVELRFGDSAEPVGSDQLAAVPHGPRDLSALLDRFSQSVASVEGIGAIEAHRATEVGHVSIVAPAVPGGHDLVLRLRAGGRLVAQNRYPIHVVDSGSTDSRVRAIGDATTTEALTAVGARIDEEAAVLVIGEGSLDPASGASAAEVLDRGGIVLVLAQEPAAAAHLPVAVELTTVVTAWGSPVYHFTTDHGAVESLPRRNVVVGEDSTVQATSIVTAIAGARFPDTPVVLAFKPVPDAIAGTIVGATDVGRGRLVFCQYRLAARAAAGDAAAIALLADLVRWVARARPVMERADDVKPDGRRTAAYRWASAAAR